MQPEKLDKLLELQERQTIALEKIAKLIQQSLPRQPAPNYKAILEHFEEFDWSSIDATVEIKDKYGAATVIWNNQRYKRRSPSNSYGVVIFFSRGIGKTEDGRNQYERLITFEPFNNLQVEPISKRAEDYLR